MKAELDALRQRLAELEADRRQAEQVLERAHSELEARVAERTEALWDANDPLQREAEKHRRTEEQLQAIYDGMNDGVLIAEVDSKRFVRANHAISEMLGYSEQELLSMSVPDIHRPEDLPLVLQHFQALAEHRLLRTESTPVLRRDGSVFYAEIRSNLISYGSTRCVIGFFRDVTERRLAREDLEREHRVSLELLKSQDRERQLIAYEIHDGLAQYLVAATMQLESLAQDAVRGSQEVQAKSQMSLELVREALDETRRLISGLRPPLLDQLGVVAGIGQMVQQASARDGPEIEYRTRVKFDRLEPFLENAIYRIVQECLNNARRHSQSPKVLVELVQKADQLQIEVTDWGVGFDPSALPEGRYGLEGISQRARLLGGQAVVHSAPSQGTRVWVELPLASRCSDPAKTPPGAGTRVNR